MSHKFKKIVTRCILKELEGLGKMDDHLELLHIYAHAYEHMHSSDPNQITFSVCQWQWQNAYRSAKSTRERIKFGCKNKWWYLRKFFNGFHSHETYERSVNSIDSRMSRDTTAPWKIMNFGKEYFLAVNAFSGCIIGEITRRTIVGHTLIKIDNLECRVI